MIAFLSNSSIGVVVIKVALESDHAIDRLVAATMPTVMWRHCITLRLCLAMRGVASDHHYAFVVILFTSIGRFGWRLSFFSYFSTNPANFVKVVVFVVISFFFCF